MRNSPFSLRISKIFHFLAFLFFIVVCFCGWRVAKKFGVVTLDQIFFHLMAPMDGMDRELVVWGIRYAAITLGIIALYYILAFSRGAASVLAKVHIRRPDSPCWHSVLGAMFLCVALVFAQVRYDADAYFWAKESSFIKDNYAKFSAEDVRFPVKKNAVILILESMGNLYNNTEVFSEPLLPRLQRVQRENLSFENQKQVYGTGWTIAGLTSYLFGLPLLLFKNQGNVLFDDFMPNAVCGLSVLEGNGYSIEYVLSSSAIFAGTDKMFASHSKAFVQDSKYLANYKPKDATGIWGVPDSFMYQWAKGRYEDLSKQDKPFALIVQTIDTHGYAGFVEKQNVRHGDFRDVLAAADTMACDFIEWLKAQENFEDTVIIVLGDHLTGQNPLYDKYLLPNQSRRTISNAFINAVPQQNVDRKRLCTSMDMAPTILEAMGAILPEHRLGLGTSLFSKEKTLIEKLGEEALNEELKKKSDFYKKLFYK